MLPGPWTHVWRGCVGAVGMLGVYACHAVHIHLQSGGREQSGCKAVTLQSGCKSVGKSYWGPASPRSCLTNWNSRFRWMLGVLSNSYSLLGIDSFGCE